MSSTATTFVSRNVQIYRLSYLILVGNTLDSLDQFKLTERLVQGQVSVELDVIRNSSVSELIQAGVAKLLQHCPGIVLPGSNVTGREVCHHWHYLLQLAAAPSAAQSDQQRVTSDRGQLAVLTHKPAEQPLCTGHMLHGGMLTKD